MSSILLPPEMAEITASAVKPMSSKKRRKLEKSAQQQSQQGENLLSAMASNITNTAGHREKLAPAGDQLDPLVAWYSLVAKPVPRTEWQNSAKATTATTATNGQSFDSLGKSGHSTGLLQIYKVF
jgi:hypothetical protein